MTHFMLSYFFPKIVVSKNVVEPEMPQTIWRMRVTCWISKATRALARASTPTPIHARTCMHSPTLARTRSDARTHAHAHTQKYVILIAFPRQRALTSPHTILRVFLIQLHSVSHFAPPNITLPKMLHKPVVKSCGDCAVYIYLLRFLNSPTVRHFE